MEFGYFAMPSHPPELTAFFSSATIFSSSVILLSASFAFFTSSDSSVNPTTYKINQYYNL